ncbi:MAG TPA: 4-hydroxybutyrate CoA-transferase, partial [Burkholderiales bacterium]
MAMNNESVYSSKLRTPEEEVSAIASGSTVALGMAMSQPPSLLAALATRASVGDVDALKVYYFHAESFLSKTLLLYELMGRIQPHCMFLGEPERKLIRRGAED